MLTLGRYKGQGLFIDDCYLHVADISPVARAVRLVVEGPASVAVSRSEDGMLAHERLQLAMDNGTPPKEKPFVVNRCVGEGLYVDMDMYIKVVEVSDNSGGLVRIAIDCPSDVAVTRSELGLAVHRRAQEIRDRGGVPTREDLQL
jgi:carbon storage regulator CsrA